MSRISSNNSSLLSFFTFCLLWSSSICRILTPKISNTVLYTATSDLEKLIHAESRLTDFLNQYIEAEETNLERLKKYSSQGKDNQQLIVDYGIGKFMNPVNIFLTYKRVDAWRFTEEYLRNGTDPEILDILQLDPVGALGSLLPSQEDLNGAANALFRLQDTYNLKARTLSEGQLLNDLFTETLTAGECFELGQIAFSTQDHYHALIWFQEAWRKLKSENPPTANIRQTLDFLSSTLYIQGNMEYALFILRRLRAVDPDYLVARDAMAFFEDELRKQGRDPNKVALKAEDLPPLVNERYDDGHFEDRDGYEALCRGENQDESEWPKLYCHYKSDTPYSRIAPFKVEVVRIKDPKVVIFRNIVTDREVEMMKSLAEPKFHTTEHLLTYRVSKSAWVHDIEDSLVKSFSNRIEHATGLSTSSAEALHLSCYGIGGHYEPHHDYYRLNEEDNATFSYIMERGGNRIATVLLYMSTPYFGGATVFTDLKLTLYPTKNDAAFWYNLLPNGTVDVRTRHAACPVLAGTKWIGNKWLHEKDQEFRYPCPLENN